MSKGITMRQASAQRQACRARCTAISRAGAQPRAVPGFVEAHIEQGLYCELVLPLGNHHLHQHQCALPVRGDQRSDHAGTTPMVQATRRSFLRSDWPCMWNNAHRARWRLGGAPSECCTCPQALSTWCPGAASSRWTCGSPATRSADALVATCCKPWRASASAAACAARTGFTLAAAAPQSHLSLAATLGAAPVAWPCTSTAQRAGHDATSCRKVMPQLCCFVRGQNAGISHSPLESTSW